MEVLFYVPKLSLPTIRLICLRVWRLLMPFGPLLHIGDDNNVSRNNEGTSQ